MRILSCLVALAALACTEEKPAPEPNKPTVLSASLSCRQVEGVNKLEKLEFAVRDNDGAADIQEPVVVVEATRLAVTKTEVSTADEECESEDQKCTARYVWEHSRDAAQIYCGENNDSLVGIITVKDAEGWQTKVKAKVGG